MIYGNREGLKRGIKKYQSGELRRVKVENREG
jgi:hypothetical protein